MTKHIDTATADRIYELVRKLHIDAAAKAQAEGDADSINALVDNWNGLHVKFGAK